MELMEKQGYKQTDLGTIPNDWEVILLGDSLLFKNGLNKASEFFGYGTPIINYMDVFKNYGIRNKDIVGKVFLNSHEKNNFSARKGDVFFTRTSETQEEIGTSAVLLEDVKDCVFSGFVLRGRPFNSKIIPEYYQYCLVPNYVRTQIIATSSYTTRALTNGRYLSKVKIIIPKNHKEQKAIANALSDVDELITNLNKLIAKKSVIKQGAMQQLLTPPHKGGKRLDGFSGEWEEKKLGDVGEIITGGTPSTNNKLFWEGNIPWITPTDIGKNKDIKTCERYLTIDGLKSIRKLPKDSLLVTCIASIGKNAILRKNGACNQQINAIIPNETNNVDFLYYLIEINNNVVKSKAGITATLMVSKKVFSEIKFNFPPTLQEQKAIAEILSDMDLEIEQLESKKAKYQSIKQGMMQELLTGKTRLI